MTALIVRIHRTSTLAGSAGPTRAVYGIQARNRTTHRQRLTIVSRCIQMGNAQALTPTLSRKRERE